MKKAKQNSMRKKWSEIKRIIGEVDVHQEKFISLISDDGTILSANAKMVRSLHLGHPKSNAINLFDLLHPVNQDIFRERMDASGTEGTMSCVEAYLKNGLYHPMKWHISPVREEGNGKKYLCQGY